MAHGYPQNIDEKFLKEYIKTSSYRLAIKKKITTEVIINQVSHAPLIKY